MQFTAIWLIAVIVFAVVEGATYQIISIWFAFGAVGAMISTFFNASFTVQMVIFLLVSIICIVFTRPVFKKMLGNRIEKTNVDAIIGKEALVIEDIDNILSKGQVKVAGNVWSARSVDGSSIESDSVVSVEKIEGVKLIVSKK